MNHTGFAYRVMARVTLTREEVETATALARAHYDNLCKDTARPGGLLFGLNNRLHLAGNPGLPEDEIDVALTFRDADLLAKVTEQLMYPGEALIPAACRLHAELMLVMHKMNAEYERMHPRTEETK
jgi:hypothetical protein